MKNGMIIVKKKTWSSKVEIDYLDETSPKKQQQLREKNMTAVGEKLRQFNEYADKDNLGRVYVGGFFYKAVARNPDGTFTAPTNLSKDETKRRLLKIWRQHLKPNGAPRGVVQHRFVISMSKEQYDLLIKYGLNPEAFLHDRVRLVMKEFREEFHAGDSIGYAYGLHHDTDNLHAHIAVCPRSERQEYIGLSEQLQKKQSPSGHKNQLGFLKKICARENEKLEKSFSTFTERQRLFERLQQHRHADEYFFIKAQLPPPLPTTDNHKTYAALQQEQHQIHNQSRQIQGQQKLFHNTVSMLPRLVNPMPQELWQIRKLTSSIASVLLLAQRLRQSRHSLIGSRYRYFQLHKTYYHPLAYAINTRNQKLRRQQRSAYQSQQI
jgi:hypothetical protein